MGTFGFPQRALARINRLFRLDLTHTICVLFVGLMLVAFPALAGEENQIPSTENIRAQVESALVNVCPSLKKEEEAKCKIELLRLNVMAANYDAHGASCRLHSVIQPDDLCPLSGVLVADRYEINRQIEKIRKTYGW